VWKIGKPASFSGEEINKLRDALGTQASFFKIILLTVVLDYKQIYFKKEAVSEIFLRQPLFGTKM